MAVLIVVVGLTLLLQPWGEMNTPVAFFSIALTVILLPLALLGTLIWTIRRRRQPPPPAPPRFPQRPR